MTATRVLAIDAGTTGIRVILFNSDSQVCASDYRPITQIMPEPGLVEHDPSEIWSITRDLLLGVVSRAGISPTDIASIGIASQRSTTVLWDRATGKPLHNAIVWQDQRAVGRCPELSERLGVAVHPLKSLPRMEWLLQHVPNAGARVATGTALISTIDSWLIWNLTGGQVFVTDPSSATATDLYEHVSGEWSGTAANLIGVPVERLARICPTSAVYGYTDPGIFGTEVPVAATAGDQQSALFGHLCTAPGEGKLTFGTAVMVDVHTGSEWVEGQGSYPMGLWWIGQERTACIEGAVITGGACLEWLQSMGIVSSIDQVSDLAASVADSGGLAFIPTLQGLGSPFMDSSTRGAILGLTLSTTPAHLARAVLEGIAFRTRQVVDALQDDAPGSAFEVLNVDGGMTKSSFFLGLLADVLDRPVRRPPTTEATALGAAYLAGLAVGFWSSVDDIRARRAPGLEFLPSKNAAALQARYAQWLVPLATVRSLGAVT